MHRLALVDLMAGSMPPGPPPGPPPPLDPRSPAARQWWTSRPAAEPAHSHQNIGTPGPWQPPTQTLTTLGWLKYLEDDGFLHFEWHYLKFLHQCLTTKWWTIQFGFDEEARNLWYLIFKVLKNNKNLQGPGVGSEVQIGPDALGAIWAHRARLCQQDHVGPDEQVGPG